MADHEQSEATLNIAPEVIEHIRQLMPEYERITTGPFDVLQRVADGAMQIGQMRTAFHEKLILVAGGSFALTLTFVSSLQRHATYGTAITAMWSLKLAWICLFLCIFLSWIHNWCRAAVVECMFVAVTKSHQARNHATSASFYSKCGLQIAKGMTIKEMPEIDFAQFFDVAAKIATKETEDSKLQAHKFALMVARRWNVAHATGNFALIAIGVGFLLLLGFAMTNIPLL